MPEYVGVVSHLSPEEFFAMVDKTKQDADLTSDTFALPAEESDQTTWSDDSSEVYYDETAKNPYEETESNTEKRRHPVLITLGAVAVLGIVAGTIAYTSNFNNVQTTLTHPDVKKLAASNGLVVNSVESNGEPSLNPEVCKDANNIGLIVTFSGQWPTEPSLVTSAGSTPVDVKPYIPLPDPNNPKKTIESYPNAKIQDATLAVALCIKPGDKPFVENNNVIKSIDRSQITLTFADTNTLYGLPLNVAVDNAVGSSSTATLNGKNGTTYMLPGASYFAIQPSKPDAVFDTSAKALQNAMSTEQQAKTAIAIIEKNVVDQLKNGTFDPKTITYQDASEKTLQKAVDDALYKKLGIDPAHSPNITGSYNFEVQTGTDKQTTQPLYLSPLVGLSSTPPINLSQILVQQASIELPSATSSPAPVTSPSSSPTKSTAP